MYKIYDGEKTACFQNYVQLVNALSKHNMRCGSEVWNGFLDNVGVNPGDKRVRPGMNAYLQPKDLYQLRTHRVIGPEGYSIYDSFLVQDVLNWTFSQEVYKQYLVFLGRGGPFHYYQLSAYSEFRRGPVPGTSKRAGHYPYLRCIRTTQEKRLCCDPDLARLCRGSRGKNLPDTYDDIWRDCHNRGWKRQSKYRHQWEHKAVARARKAHGRGVEVVPMECIRGGNAAPDPSNLCSLSSVG